MSRVWAEPFEESVDLYPGLVVHDGRVTGSITTGRSRLPLWAFAGQAIRYGWAEEVESAYEPSEYGWTQEKMADFVYYLTEQRGEFARLLCVLADVERLDAERDEAALEGHGPVVRIKVFDTDPPDAVEIPAPWWQQDEDRERVLEALRRCIEALEAA